MVDRTPKRRGEPLEQSSKRARSTTGRVGIREQEGSEHEESDEEEDGGGGGVVAAELMHDLDSEDTEAGRGGVGSHERADAVDGGERAENADLDAQAAARSGEYAWIGELVKGGPCSFVKECSHIRAWRILPVKALRKVSKLLCKIGTTAISGPTEEDRELAWLAFFALPALLLRAKLREGSEVGPQRVEGAKPDQIIMERAIRAEKGRWTELVRELEVDIALQKAKKPGAAGQIASPGDPVSAAAADGFCRLASTGQHGKAARNVVQAPVIQPCEQLKESLPKKIYPAEETELSNLQLLRARVLQEQAPVEDVEKFKEFFRKRAGHLKQHGQAGNTGWRNEHFKALAATEAAPVLEELAVQFLTGKAPLLAYEVLGMPALSPRYKETNTPADPRPVGAPDPFWRWAVGAAVASVKAKAAKLFGTVQLAIGVPAGAEVMAHATRLDAVRNPGHIFMAPDIKNAYNSLDRVEAIPDLREFDAFIAIVAAALYTVPTRYLHTAQGADGDVYMTARGAIQGCPLGMLAFCVSYTKSASWITETMQAAGEGRGDLPKYTYEPPTQLRERLESWLAANRIADPTPDTANVVGRHYADNGVFGAVPDLVRGLPELAAACVGVKRLEYKPQWEGYSSTAKENVRQDFKLHPPEAGMVLVGGGVGPLEPSVVLGADLFVREHLNRKVKDVQDLVKTMLSVPKVAAGAFHAERLLFRVFVKTVRQRVTFLARTFPPELARPALEQIDQTYRKALQEVLGLTDEEEIRIAKQAELPFEAGGHDMAPIAPHAPLAHLASWLDATEGDTVAITKRELCECQVLSPVVQRLYEASRKVNPALPLTFQAFLDRAAADESPAVRTKAGRVRWSVRLREGLTERKVAHWCATASLVDKHRVAEMGGGWILYEPPHEAKFQRPVFQIAMRIRYGLDVDPAIPYVRVQQCGAVKGNGAHCGKALDAVGQHALACKCGGHSHHRHDACRDVLGRHLKPLVTSVKFEQFIHELAQPDEDTGETRAARLDLVVQTKDMKALLDVRIFHPLGPNGRHAGKYTLAANEKDKYDRYPTHQDGRRLTNATIVPIVVNTFGAVGEKAREFFKSLGKTARELVELVSVMGVYGSADKILFVHSPAKIPAAPDVAVVRGAAVRAVRAPQAGQKRRPVAKFAAVPAKAKAKAKAGAKKRGT